jgi:hypothetical protein
VLIFVLAGILHEIRNSFVFPRQVRKLALQYDKSLQYRWRKCSGTPDAALLWAAERARFIQETVCPQMNSWQAKRVLADRRITNVIDDVASLPNPWHSN